MSTVPVSATAALSARPTTRAPMTTDTSVPAAPKPSMNGATIRTRPSASSTAPWAGSEMRRNAVITDDMLLVDWPVNCDVGHSPVDGYLPRRGDQDPARRTVDRTRALRVAQPRRGIDPGGRGAPRQRRAARGEAGADGGRRRRRGGRGAPRLRVARGRQ